MEKDLADCIISTRKKCPVAEFENTKWVETDEKVKPEKDDFYVIKKVADGFYNTALDGILRSLEVDTILVTGCTTSGCVRATVEHGAFI